MHTATWTACDMKERGRVLGNASVADLCRISQIEYCLYFMFKSFSFGTTKKKNHGDKKTSVLLGLETANGDDYMEEIHSSGTSSENTPNEGGEPNV